MKKIDASLRVTQVTRLLAVAVFSAACGGSAVLSDQTVATNTPTQAAAATSPGATTTVAIPTASSATKASANNASNAELIAALTAAGVPNPSSWAREVQEYRPYPATDPNMAKLRQNLAKYNPAAGVVDKIISALSLP